MEQNGAEQGRTGQNREVGYEAARSGDVGEEGQTGSRGGRQRQCKSRQQQRQGKRDIVQCERVSHASFANLSAAETPLASSEARIFSARQGQASN